MKKLLSLLLLLGSLSFACPETEIHDYIEIFNKEKILKITDTQLIIYENKINKLCIKQSKKEGYPPEKYYWLFWHTFRYYAKHHKLEVVHKK